MRIQNVPTSSSSFARGHNMRLTIVHFKKIHGLSFTDQDEYSGFSKFKSLQNSSQNILQPFIIVDIFPSLFYLWYVVLVAEHKNIYIVPLHLQFAMSPNIKAC